MVMNYVIRKADKRDYSSIVHMLKTLAHEEQGLCTLTVTSLTAQITQNQPELIIYVAQADNDTLLGCLVAYNGFDVLSASRGLHLSDIFVWKKYRNLGVGKDLMTHLANYALSLELKWISWTTLHNNTNAQRFYEHIGATIMDVTFMALGETAMKTLSETAMKKLQNTKLCVSNDTKLT